MLADNLPRASSFESATSPTAMMHLPDAEVKGSTAAMVNVQVRNHTQLICFIGQWAYIWMRSGSLCDSVLLWHAGGRQPAVLRSQCIFHTHSIPRTGCINRLFRDAVSALLAHSVDQMTRAHHVLVTTIGACQEKL